MPPYDFFLIERRIKQFQNDNNTVISMSERASFAVFQLLNGLQKKVGLESSFFPFLPCHPVFRGSADSQLLDCIPPSSHCLPSPAKYARLL
jgi:hypothetical protein